MTKKQLEGKGSHEEFDVCPLGGAIPCVCAIGGLSGVSNTRVVGENLVGEHESDGGNIDPGCVDLDRLALVRTQNPDAGGRRIKEKANNSLEIGADMYALEI